MDLAMKVLVYVIAGPTTTLRLIALLGLSSVLRTVVREDSVTREKVLAAARQAGKMVLPNVVQ
jgi:hypothetical protein